MKTSDVLRKAGDVLRERGWCQKTAEDSVGRVCSYGALGCARNGNPNCSYKALRGHEEFEMVVRGLLHSNSDGVDWNDADGRTAAEVMHALDAAYVLALQLEGEDLDEYEAL